MGTAITKRPEQLIESGYTSRWVAIGHPSNKALFQFSRKDSTVLVSRESGDGTVQLVGVDRTISITIGSKIWVDLAVAHVSGVVTSVFENILGAVITTDIPWEERFDINFSVTNQTSYLNVTSNRYRLSVSLYNADTDILINSTEHESAPSGLVNYDAGPYLRSEMEVKCELDDTVVNEPDDKLSVPFYITYQVNYLDEDEDEISDEDNVYTGVFASMRVDDTHGQIMGQHTAFDADLIESKKAKFTTRFDKPCYFPGYPFSLGIMYTGENTPWKEEIFRDLNRAPVGGDSRELDESVNYDFFQRIYIEENYADNIREVDVLLSQDGTEIGCLALDPTDFFVNWVLDENDELQRIELQIVEDNQVQTIDTYPDALLYNGVGVLVETITHGGSGVYTPTLTHTIDTGIWKVEFIDIEVTLKSGDACDISIESEWDSSWCGIDYDSIENDLIVYADT